MKDLKMYVKESIFDDVEDIVNNDTVLIDAVLKKDYDIRGTYVINKDGAVDVDGDVYVKNTKLKTLTDGLFRFGKVSGCFDCFDCCNLTTLEDAPEKVGRNFCCRHCSKLTSLEGAPKKINIEFDCGDCENLTSLEGVPEKIGGGFYCNDCPDLKITDSDRKKYKI